MSEFFKKYQFWFRCWGIVFGALLLVYSFYIFTFTIGNHDWRFIRYGMPLKAGFWEARFTQFVPSFLLTLGQMIPVLNAFLAFLFLSGGVVLSAKWFGVDERYRIVLTFSFLVVLNPYVITQLYYVHQLVSVFCWQLFSVSGVVCAWYFIAHKKWRYLCGCLFFLVTALCGYGSCAEFILTLICAKFLIDIAITKKLTKNFYRFYVLFIGVVLFAFACYAGIVYCFFKKDLISDRMYNLQTLSLFEVLNKIKDNPWESFYAIFNSVPYQAAYVGYFYIFTIIAVLYLVWKDYKKRFLLFVLSGYALMLSMYAVAYISPRTVFDMMRIHIYSFPYLAGILFVLILVLCTKKNFLISNVLWVAVLPIIGNYIYTDVMVQKVWVLGNTQDERLYERVRSRLLPALKPQQHYRLSVVGDVFGKEKFSNQPLLSDADRERLREFYGYPLYLKVFFSTSFLAYEDFNPIWGDAMFLGGKIGYVINSEGVEEQDKVQAYLFSRHGGLDKKEQLHGLTYLRPFPANPFYFVGEKDIFLMLSRDNEAREILRQKIY